MGADRIPKPAVSLAAKLSSFQELLPQKVRSTFADLVIDVDNLEGVAAQVRAMKPVVRAMAHAAVAADLPERAGWEAPMPAACIDLTAERRLDVLAHLPTSALLAAVKLCGAAVEPSLVAPCSDACSPVPRPDTQ